MVVRIKKMGAGIESLSDLFDRLGKSQSDGARVNLYRGHSDKAHGLIPSLFRQKEYRRNERNILRELIAIQPNEFRDDKTTFEQLVRMQHYGLPTRLLDLTYNPLVALYFACWKDPDRDGEFISLTVPARKVRHFDSDTVSCIANLANLSGRERDRIRSFATSTALRKSEVGTRLLHFIKAEKAYFLPRIVLSDLKSVVAVRPKQANRRILAQHGAFLLFGLKTSLIETNDFEIEIRRTAVTAAAKPTLLKELDRININGSTLFPEIESAAKYIISKIPLSADSDEAAD